MIDSLTFLLSGFEVALTWQNIFLVLLGGLVGTIIGMLPGIGPINAIAILFPVVYTLEVNAVSVMIMFAGIFYGAQYGNSISSILMNVPGTSASAVTTLDGYALAKQGRGGAALAMSAIASFCGGTLTVFLLVLLVPITASFAIDFGPAEYTMLMLFAFSALASFSEGSLPKAFISAGLGLTIASVGIDPLSGVARYTFESRELFDGIDFIVVVIGFFAVSELMQLLLEKHSPNSSSMQTLTKLMLTRVELKSAIGVMLRSSGLGFVVGVLPGAGATIASFMAYASEKRLAGDKGKFGKGDLRGVAAPEAANNASAVGSFIPLLILGVPGSETTAVMLGGLISLGITPGPLLLDTNPQLFWGLAASMFIGNLFLILLNLPLVGIFAKILLTPRWILMPVITLLSVVGVFTISGNPFDLVLMVIFGLMGLIMRRTGFPLAPLVLGVVLGGLIETNFRRALVYSSGDFGVFFDSPICKALWVISIISLFAPLVTSRIKRLASRNPATPE